MATITPKQTSLDGVDPLTYPTASGGGDVFPADPAGRYLIHVKNGEAGSRSLVIDDPNSKGPGSATTFDPDVTNAVPNGGERVILIADAKRFRNNSSGQIALSWTGGTVALVTFQVFRV